MQVRVKSPEDFWAGVIFILIGALAVYLSWDYPKGSGFRMGPGYFPTLLGVTMIGFGLVITFLAFKLELENPAHVPWAIRPWLALPGSLVVFGLMMRWGFGFVPSLVALVVGSSLAHKDAHLRETLVLAVLLPIVCVLVFIYGLGLPYRLFWWN